MHHNQIELDAEAIVESLPCEYWHNQIESDSDAIVESLTGSLSFPGGLSLTLRSVSFRHPKGKHLYLGNYQHSMVRSDLILL